jgi:hypothetical protein
MTNQGWSGIAGVSGRMCGEPRLMSSAKLHLDSGTPALALH